jgi:hypothetical protein
MIVLLVDAEHIIAAKASQPAQQTVSASCLARTAIEPHLGAVLPGDHPKSVMLDFVQP